MPIRDDERTSARGRASYGRLVARSRACRARLVALLVVLPIALLLASTVQASASSAAEREARAAAREAEHVARHEAKQAALTAKHEAVLRARKEHEELLHPNGDVVFACNQVTWHYKAFPDLPGNTVSQVITIAHDHSTQAHSTFTFDGPSATETTQLDGHAGRYQVDVWAIWNTNGLKGHFDLRATVTCPPAPALSIEKLQRIGGTAGTFTASTLTGEVGQTVEYEMVVKNTGNTALTLGALADPHCDAGTIAGGPGAGSLAQGASTTFACTHLLNAADQAAGSYANIASDTATPVGGSSPVRGESNTVLAQISPSVSPPGEKPAEKPAGNTSATSTGTSSATSGVLALTAAKGLSGTSPKSGVLASKATAIPSLATPAGCVRSSFRASVRAAGVSSASFYMDRHRLKTMAAKSARKGRLTITIDPSRLSVGAHRLIVKLTMLATSFTSKPRHATRTSTVLRCRSAVLTPRFTG